MPHLIECGDVLDELQYHDDDSFDGCLTDPPYGIGFMGKAWDHGVPSVDVWKEVLRVMKPGAMLLAFGGTRTWHRLAVNIEDAGFEIRDTLMWLYGSGFPKSHDISKGIDRAAGARRQVIGDNPSSRSNSKKSSGAGFDSFRSYDADLESAGIQTITAPATDAAQQWQGYGTALKPAWEPIILAMKPLDDTFAANAMRYGVAGLNIDECRIGSQERFTYGRHNGGGTNTPFSTGGGADITGVTTDGRWPANIIHDGSPEVVGLFPDAQPVGRYKDPTGDCVTDNNANSASSYSHGHEDKSGVRRRSSRFSDDRNVSASRFFYCAKVSRNERHLGDINCRHPTLKPIRLTTYLAALIRPPKGIDSELLVPYSGAGSEIIGALKAGWSFVHGITDEPEHCDWAESRIRAAMDVSEFDWRPVKRSATMAVANPPSEALTPDDIRRIAASIPT